MALLQGLPGFAGNAPAAHVADDGSGDAQVDDDGSMPISPAEVDKITGAAQDGAEGAQAQPPAKQPEAEQPPKNQADYMQRLAAKDRKYVELRQQFAAQQQKLQEYEQFDQAMRSGNRIEALHNRYKVSLPELNRQWLDMGEGAQGQAQGAGFDLSGLPPELQKALAPVVKGFESKLSTLEQQNAELAKRAKQADEQQQTLQQQEARKQQVGLVSNYLGTKVDAFPLVNDLGLHDQVYDRVVKHVQTHGQFETDQDAAYVIEQVAAEVERAEVERINALAAKPAYRKFLLQVLGAQKEAKPARQETRAPNGRSNGAAPAVPNSLATQRASRGKAPDWQSLPIEEQLQRTTELAIQRQ